MIQCHFYNKKCHLFPRSHLALTGAGEAVSPPPAPPHLPSTCKPHPPAPSPALSPQSAVPGPATLCPADYRWLRAFGFPPWTVPEEASLLVAGRAHNPLWGQTLGPVPTLPGQPPSKYSHAPSQTWPPLSAALNHFPTEKLLRLPMPENKIHSGTAIKGFCKTWLMFPAHFQPFHGSPAPHAGARPNPPSSKHTTPSIQVG